MALMLRILAVVLLATFAGGAVAAPTIPWTLVHSYPHGRQAFTEGLAIRGDQLIESNGLYGQSRVTLRKLRSGEVLARHRLPANLFGEGLAVVGKRIVQLTWHAGIGFVYDDWLDLQRQFRFHGQGWGLAYDGRRLILSDGSDRLRFLDPQSYAPVGHALAVRDGDQAVDQLNELEWADGRIYANIWHDARIAVINPGNGQVTGWLDLSPLVQRQPQLSRPGTREDVLNGIAWDPATGHFFVTGKNWPQLYEIAVAGVGPAPASGH